ncbi:MAG: hypothetical protein HYV28_09790 [Ignavibacteriales bacterium]|nr:hypothetical protein [Ignavibacteriales bacterium]
MRKNFFLIGIICFTSVLSVTGCGGMMKNLSSFSDATSSYEDKDTLINLDIMDLKNWSIYEVWVNENISGSIIPSTPDKSKHTKLITSPIFMSEKIPTGIQNKKTLEDWLNWMLTDADICYLAVREVSTGLNYNDSYTKYCKYFNEARKAADELFQSGLFGLQDIQVTIKMENPTKIYKNENVKYNLDGVGLVLRQSRRGLSIIRGNLVLTK